MADSCIVALVVRKHFCLYSRSNTFMYINPNPEQHKYLKI